MIKKLFLKLPLALFSCMLVVGCTSLPILKSTVKTQTNAPSLGNIGETHGAFTKTYTTAAIPDYEQPIKLSVTKLPFTKKAYQDYMVEQKKRSLPFTISYVDFIPEKPSYVLINIADKVALIDALNTEENLGEKNYLQNNTKSSIVTSVSVAFNAEDIIAISSADEVFWTKSDAKTYTLQLYTDNNPTKTISLSKGVVFDFTAATFCWKENHRHQPVIVDLTTGKCQKKSYTDPSKIKQKPNYLKL